MIEELILGWSAKMVLIGQRGIDDRRTGIGLNKRFHIGWRFAVYYLDDSISKRSSTKYLLAGSLIASNEILLLYLIHIIMKCLLNAMLLAFCRPWCLQELESPKKELQGAPVRLR